VTSRTNTSDQHSIYLSVWADHVDGAPNIDKTSFLVKGNGPCIALPNTKPNVLAIEIARRLVNRLHQHRCQTRSMCSSVHVEAVQFNRSGMRNTGWWRTPSNLRICDQFSVPSSKDRGN